MSQRDVIEPHEGDKPYARQDQLGHFTEKQVSIANSLAGDQRQTAKTIVPKSQGGRGGAKRG